MLSRSPRGTIFPASRTGQDECRQPCASVMAAASPTDVSPPHRRRWRAWYQVGKDAATNLLFPPHCTCCDGECISRPDQPLWCTVCAGDLQPSQLPTCPRCAAPCPAADAASGPCPNCRGLKLLYSEARTLGPYDGAIRQAVLRIKHAHYEPLAGGLGEQLATYIQRRKFAEPPELVAPVPMFWLQRLWRGTNAAETVAVSLARALGLPVATDLLVCRRWLKKQSTLKSDERRRNVRNAFRVSWRYGIRNARILLIDDVLTTGATAHEAARALHQAGAAAVYVAAVARSTHEP